PWLSEAGSFAYEDSFQGKKGAFRCACSLTTTVSLIGIIVMWSALRCWGIIELAGDHPTINSTNAPPHDLRISSLAWWLAACRHPDFAASHHAAEAEDVVVPGLSFFGAAATDQPAQTATASSSAGCSQDAADRAGVPGPRAAPALS